MNQKTGELWTRLTYKILIYRCSKSVKMLPCELPILRRGNTPTVYKELLPKNRPLFTCTNGHRGWQVTQGTKFRQVVKEKEKWHRWSVTDELCIHHVLQGKQVGELLLLSAWPFMSDNPWRGARGKIHSCQWVPYYVFWLLKTF